MKVNQSKTRELVESYYDELSKKRDWQNVLSDDFLLTGAVKAELRGRDGYASLGFFKMVRSVKIKALFVRGKRAAALIGYDLVSPKGKAFKCDVAEFWRASNGKLASVAIYFDTEAFSKSMS